MDRELSKQKQNRKKLKRLILPFAAIIVITLIFTGFKGLITPGIERKDFQSAVCFRGNLDDFVTASGIVTPENERIITSPFSSKIIEVLKKPGDPVLADETILRLEDQTVKNELSRADNEYRRLLASKDKLILQNNDSISALRSGILILEKQIEALNLDIIQTEAHYKIGLSSESALKCLVLDRDINELKMERYADQLENTAGIQEASLREFELRIKRQKQLFEDLRRRLLDSSVKSGHFGVLSWINNQTGKTIVRGEQIALVSDLSSYIIRGTVSEIHSSNLAIGKEVSVLVNDDSELKGRISSIEPAVKNNNISFQIELTDTGEAFLRPDLQVTIQISSRIKKDILMLPRGYEIKGSGIKNVYVIKDNRAVEREILTGAGNSKFIEIVRGLEEGERVILSNMDRYKTGEIKIKE